ncbi:MAG TPA: aldehyde dehydrogenase [Firmicutes bacterium]|jgi:aldehyde dehydrogenase (NAD+)|nr:aldehyde dehydrogenase [Bacillota bacterium]
MVSDYHKILEQTREFFLTGKTKDVEFRINSLKKLRQTITKRNQEIMGALEKDFGKCEFETFATEIMSSLDEINMAIRNLHSWVKPRKVRTPLIHFKASSRIYYEPFGTVLVISAWNYPFQLTMNPLIGALAAGNCCIVKPSEMSPNTSKLMAEIVAECFPEDYCTVVEGGVEETTLLLKEKFDFIHYTGSTRVGKIIARAAAEHLTPVALEMGGKSPCIVDKTADIEISARRIAWGKFMNAGQTCVAPDYLIVHRDVKDALLKAFKERIHNFYGDEPEQSSDYCRIINQKHFDRLSSFLDQGTIITGGKANRENLYIEPTIIDDITWNDPVMQEEIFGPILPVMEYQDLTAVIDMIHSHEKPLALYFFSKNKKDQKKIIHDVSFGGGCINTTILHTGNPYLPFGGVGNSGIGNYHGKWSFETFSHPKSIFDKSLMVDPKLPYPPYGHKLKFLKMMYR